MCTALPIRSTMSTFPGRRQLGHSGVRSPASVAVVAVVATFVGALAGPTECSPLAAASISIP
jgi:hypothetical protein